jgi:CheY-like chemotaxis protein
MSILMIEDEFLVAAEIRFHLNGGGFHEVEHAATERDALAAIAARDWEAAVVDANLDGVGVERIADALQKKGIPFVIVTGYGRKGLPQAIADVPVIDKPFRPGTLLDTLTRLCAPGRHPLTADNTHDNT